MSLLQVGEGLLQTHVTWCDIEKDMQEALDTVATFGPNKKVTNIGEGNGFASRVCLIDPDWQNETNRGKWRLVNGQWTKMDLPKKFVVKIISMLTMVEVSKKMGDNSIPIDMESFGGMDEKMKQCHNVEAQVYDLIQRHGRGNIPHTKIYKLNRFGPGNTSKGYMIMEYLNDLAAVHGIDNVEPEALDKVLKGLAAFERITLEMTDKEKALHPTGFFEEMCAILFQPKSLEMSLLQLEKFFGDEMVDEMKKVREYTQKLTQPEHLRKLDNMHKTLGMKPVLVHGDLWSTNMLWSKKNGKHEVRAIIDFQTAHIGCGAADLCRMFCSLLGGKARQDNWETLAEKFHGYLRKEMGNNLPYTLAQLKEAYRRIFPMAAFFVAFGIPSMLGYITEFRKGEERENTLEVVREKAKGLIDDFIKGFERNEKLGVN